MAEMNTNTAELLQQMIDIKKDMRTAISNKGVTVVSGMESYPSAIDSIQTGDIIIDGSNIDYTQCGWSSTSSNAANMAYPMSMNNLMTITRHWGNEYNKLSETELRNQYYTLNSDGLQCIMFSNGGAGVFNNVVIAPEIQPILSGINIFASCQSLQYVPELNFTRTTSLSHAFHGCLSLTNIPKLLTTGVTHMHYAFAVCKSLTMVPQMDTSSVTTFSNAFSGCKSLIDTGNLNYSSAIDCDHMFYECGLKKINPIDFSTIEDASYMFAKCGSIENGGIIEIEGLTNIGKTVNFNSTGMFLSTLLTTENMRVIVDGLYDRNKPGYNYGTITFDAAIGTITTDIIETATSKNWMIKQ